MIGGLNSDIQHEQLITRLRDASVVAGRMAHDFDNILTSVIGFSDLTLPRVQGDETTCRYISEIAQAGERARLFTQQLHELSRSHNAEPHATELGKIIGPLTQSLHKEYGSNAVPIECAFPTVLKPVKMGPTPMTVLFKHLLQNAMEAIPAAAPITITACNVELNQEQASHYLGNIPAGSYVEVTIHDHGPGIAAKIENKLFHELFVTTKVRRRGLGLAIVYSTLTAHRGSIVLQSNCAPPTGTMVRLALPAASVQAPVPSYSANPVIAFGR